MGGGRVGRAVVVGDVGWTEGRPDSRGGGLAARWRGGQGDLAVDDRLPPGAGARHHPARHLVSRRHHSTDVTSSEIAQHTNINTCTLEPRTGTIKAGNIASSIESSEAEPQLYVFLWSESIFS